MVRKVPILLSFYALSNGTTALIGGQLTYTTLTDISFKNYSRRRTFKTLLSLYRTKPYVNENIVLVFNNHQLPVTTDAHGSFYMKTLTGLNDSVLQKVVLGSAEEVTLIEGLYSRLVNTIQSQVIVVSDIDDTLMHSFIYRKLLKFRTLMFTSIEKRKAVDNMQHLLQQIATNGACPFYLSNSEQNLYPLIYRFLVHNKFPDGPVFLKKMRSLWDVLRNIKFPLLNIHKQQTLEELLSFFPDKKFVFMGDNTQHDLLIYLDAAQKFPGRVEYIIIRKVVEKKSDKALIEKYAGAMETNNTHLYYADEFPSDFKL
jgi:phosphatidate phosphatase APP1